MSATCPSCSWSDPTLVSSHGATSYLRCICGQWLVSEHGTVVAQAGTSTLANRIS
ncbi:hypothetical protein [Nocardia sp. CA-119907]|uniref:hypothetical protein n=1 Tax=Nocardia sp. CA-119907 TaxID=3239973 RepID=UPI003D9625CA